MLRYGQGAKQSMGYSRWTLADLHVHTPADKAQRYGDVGGREPNDAFAEALIKTHAERGVKIMAVTDHNRVDWWPSLYAAGRRHGVTVFPGLEVNVTKCHVVMIWDCNEGGYERAEYYLGSLFGPGQKLLNPDQSPRAIEKGSVLDQAENAHKTGALVFAAHATHTSMGLFGHGVCNISSSVAKSEFILGFDVWGSPGCDVLSNPRTEFGDRRPAWFMAGDTRSLDTVGRRATYLKVCEQPSLESLRQAFLMPDTRIRLMAEHRNKWGHTRHAKFLEMPTASWGHAQRITIAGGFH
ncbi:MAG: PHP domain-containing protein, partial [Sciscionella sp.]